LPEPLRATEKGTFTESSVAVRLPRIVRLVAADFREGRIPAPAAYTSEVGASLESLAAEIPYQPVRPIVDPGAPDEADWAGYLAPYLSASPPPNWLEIPWLLAETYLYRRLLALTGYFQPGPGLALDPYLAQKRLGLEDSLPAIEAVLLQYDPQAGDSGLAPALSRALSAGLWGNQADLSMWPVGAENSPDRLDQDRRDSFLVSDQRPAVLDYLLQSQAAPGRIDLILDNTGLELIADLGLADFLLSSGLASGVRFHLKSHPTFISDTILPDVGTTLDALAAGPSPAGRALAGRLGIALADGRLQFSQHFFWNSPLPGWELPEELRQELGEARLLISKGDANYRRLLGDRHWPEEMPAAAIWGYLPAPLVALRVLKSECVAGLASGQAERLDRLEKDWRYNGRWAVIQFG
jgi:hypothetical protein